MAERSKGGISWSAAASSASTRPSASVSRTSSVGSEGVWARTMASASSTGITRAPKAIVAPPASTARKCLGKEPAHARGFGHAAHRQHVSGRAHVHLVSLGQLVHLLEGPLHELLQLLVDLDLVPEVPLHVLGPFE